MRIDGFPFELKRPTAGMWYDLCEIEAKHSGDYVIQTLGIVLEDPANAREVGDDEFQVWAEWFRGRITPFQTGGSPT